MGSKRRWNCHTRRGLRLDHDSSHASNTTAQMQKIVVLNGSFDMIDRQSSGKNTQRSDRIFVTKQWQQSDPPHTFLSHGSPTHPSTMKTSTFLVATLLVVGLACASATSFDDFCQKYGKTYHSVAEREHRRSVFQENMKRITRWNREAELLGKQQVYNVTKFMDFTPEEFSSIYLNFKEPAVKEGKVANFDHVESVPSSVDWRSRNVITAVKNQAQCGSCWAFSATETVESYWALAGHGLVDLSPQQVTACTTGCYGCQGGYTTVAFDYLEKAGLESARAYPYTAGNGNTGTCKYNSEDVVARITGWEYAAQNGDEKALQAAVATKGPISICVDASSWQFYTGGIMSSNCGQQLDHCVQLVGYNTEGQTPYWIVRNSWTAEWGINGYIYVEAFDDDLCGIANCATYVTV